MDEEKRLTGERNAMIEIGHTEITPMGAKVFSFIFTAMIVSIPAIHTIRHSETVGSIFPAIEAAFQTNSPREFNNTMKKGFHDYEEVIDETSPTREAFLKLYKKYAIYRNQFLK